MKKDELYNPSFKSSEIPFGIIFRLAERRDGLPISHLMAERNPSIELTKHVSNANREFDRMDIDSNYKLYAAELNGVVIGFCRFYHSAGLPADKKNFQALKAGTVWAF